MKEKEPTLFEETSVTIYEHDHGYTFFVLIIGQLWYTSFANVCQLLRTFVARAAIVGLSIFPRTMGQYACTTMLFLLQYLTISVC